MRNLLLLILKFKDALFFAFLALISLYLTVNFNHLNRVNWLHASNTIGGSIQQKTSNITGYFNLAEENQKLASSNAKMMANLILLNRQNQSIKDSLFALYTKVSKDSTINKDSSYTYPELISNIDSTASFLPVNIVYNTITNNSNYISINKGKREGIQSGCGLITENGILGKVISTSENFSLVKSILNRNNKISGKLKNSNELGSLLWEDKDLNSLILKDIPRHEKITFGDTVITTEYNSVYPINHPIGVISDIILGQNEPFYKLRVKLFENLGNVSKGYVYIDQKNIEKKALIVQKDTLP